MWASVWTICLELLHEQIQKFQIVGHILEGVETLLEGKFRRKIWRDIQNVGPFRGRAEVEFLHQTFALAVSEISNDGTNILEGEVEAPCRNVDMQEKFGVICKMQVHL
jgi:hypothetical protein